MLVLLLPLSFLLRAHVTVMIDKRCYCRVASFHSSVVYYYYCCCCCELSCPLFEPLAMISVVSMRDLEHSLISWYLNIRDIFRLFLLFCWLRLRIVQLYLPVTCAFRFWNKMAVICIRFALFSRFKFFHTNFYDLCIKHTESVSLYFFGSEG